MLQCSPWYDTFRRTSDPPDDERGTLCAGPTSTGFRSRSRGRPRTHVDAFGALPWTRATVPRGAEPHCWHRQSCASNSAYICPGSATLMVRDGAEPSCPRRLYVTVWRMPGLFRQSSHTSPRVPTHLSRPRITYALSTDGHRHAYIARRIDGACSHARWRRLNVLRAFRNNVGR